MQLRAAATSLAALVFASCSYAVDFAVVNRLDAAATVTVRLFATQSCWIREDVRLLGTAPSEAIEPGLFRRKHPDWVSLRPSLISIDDSECSFRVQIGPRTAIRVARFYNHPPPRDSESALLAVQEVSVKWWPGGAVRLDVEALKSSFLEARPLLFAVFPEPAA